MKTFILIIFLIVFNVVLFTMYLNQRNKQSTDIEQLKEQNKQYQTHFDSLGAVNNALNLSLEAEKVKVQILFEKDAANIRLFENNQDAIKSLKTKYEKVNRIDSFKSNDILRYFTDSIGR